MVISEYDEIFGRIREPDPLGSDMKKATQQIARLAWMGRMSSEASRAMCWRLLLGKWSFSYDQDQQNVVNMQ